MMKRVLACILVFVIFVPTHGMAKAKPKHAHPRKGHSMQQGGGPNGKGEEVQEPVSAPTIKQRSADEPPQPSPQASSPAGGPPDAVSTSAPVAEQSVTGRSESAALDFDLLGDSTTPVSPLSTQEQLDLEEKVRRRRLMLELHPAFGFTTLGALAATVVVGQLNFDDKYRGGGDTGKYYNLHLGLAIGTSALFAATGLLGVFAPEPFEKHAGWDTATVHKSFMALATVGMLTQLVLGVVTKSREGNLDQRTFAEIHQTVGYCTLGAMTAGMLTLFF